MSGDKSRVFTYLLALIGGIFGLHHLYLGHFQHAFVWLTTLGGFGIGIFYEIIFLLNKYVRQVNHDELIIQEYKKKIQERKSPAFELKRFIGQHTVAIFYGFITYYAFPDTWQQNKILVLFIGFCTALAIALGTYLAGTLGPRKCSFIWPFLGAILGIPFLIGSYGSSPSFNIVALISSWILEWKIDWDPEYFVKKSESTKKRQRSDLKKHCLIFVAGGVLFGLVFTGFVYHNLQVNINGESVKIKDILTNFFKSRGYNDLYQEIVGVGQELYMFYRHYGLDGIWTRVWEILEFENDRQAYDVLELGILATQKDIESQCRALSRKWHPDRYRDPEEKQKAEITFMDIQDACNRLSNERQRRQMLNTQKRENPN